jgi:hypothetical protein
VGFSQGSEGRFSFLKKRNKKLFRIGVGAGAAKRYSNKSFCFFFQKEALSSFI